MNDKVSVLIPVYNRPELVVRSIRSALAQTHRNLEIVVSDNASTDSTWQVVQRLAAEDCRIRVFRNATNLGPTRNWIRALSESTGDYVKVLFSDDWLEPTCIARLVERIHGEPEVSLAFTAAIAHHADGDVPLSYFPETSGFCATEYIRRALLPDGELPVSPGVALVRRKVARFRNPVAARAARLNEIGERYGAGPDLLFLLEAAAASKRVAYIPEFLIHLDGGRTSITVNHWPTVEIGYRLAREQFAGEVPWRLGLWEIKTRLLARRWRRRIKEAVGLGRWDLVHAAQG